MKESFQKATQTFARAIIQPVMFMAVSGLIISIAAIMKMEFMPGLFKTIGDFFFGIITSGVIGSLSIIFCVGIATALAKKKTDAAITAVSTFMIFLFANNAWLTLTNRLAKEGEMGLFGTGQNTVLGIQVNDMGVFLGIILGCLVGFMLNRFGNVKFHKYLAPYEGTKFAFVLTLFVTIFLAIIITYIWPMINSGINFLVDGMAKSGPFGFFGYGFLNRMLLPVGMHHLLWMPMLYTPVGGTAEIAGQAVSGAYNIWLAQLGDIGSVTQMNPAIGFLTNFGPLALPLAISLAFIKTARPENKAKVKAIVFPTVIVAALAGVTEPIEFLFLFTAPVLWVIHAVVFGLGYFFSDILGLKVMIGSIPETIPSLFVPLNLGHQYWILPIALGLGIIEYFAFKTVILKLNLPTIGREAMLENDDENTMVAKEKEAGLAILVQGLGGVSNIVEVYNCYTRLRCDVKDASKVDINLLKTFPSSGVVDKQKHIQIIIGIGVETLREDLENYIENLKSGKLNLPSTLKQDLTIHSNISQQKKSNLELYSPAKGNILPMEQVPDEVFSGKALGDGFAVKNHNGEVYSPVDGVITNIFPTKHAIGIETREGHQILIHMGIDTVDLQGKPFTIKVQEGQSIKHGDFLAKMDTEEIKSAGKEDMVIIVAMESEQGQIVNDPETLGFTSPIFSV
ncbi:N(pi)-phosphohistidine--sugar phosphotransferase [Lactococcus garvieae subsp. garvieae]|uniref:glucose PTS transporter subunit IIA n=1 Tax=Lactococcus garvieae TaxID=1363 RepID=UPI0005A633BE|nr:glucose PTS transporter subunit IIA [Lactococcus garvieae]KAA8710670.1 N(pi)-phosphohistidine--sugar phosphotransferase [Lactococcus garvieae subsp. garvieae]MDG6191259.1 glucose PTS transporter subunit IIA [Lactococcus garvieae]PCS02909.1 PTS system, glucose subfamily, IIA component [Lactococcus garvieae]QPR49412.1 PTS glucose transporter subunit IIA [Lactococcus garvieae]